MPPTTTTTTTFRSSSIVPLAFLAVVSTLLSVSVLQRRSLIIHFKRDDENNNSLSMFRRTRGTQEINSDSCSSKPIMTPFDAAVKQAFGKIIKDPRLTVRRSFDPKKWTQKSHGGLSDIDRQAIADIYSTSNSVFEFGLGESTKIADFVGVPSYAGIDSDPLWVTQTRAAVADHFRFYLADIGETEVWGRPGAELSKTVLDYQLVPLIVEPLPFDVYLVDGRWRIGCLLTSFLHAAARGEQDLTRTKVLLHDCHRPNYDIVDDLFVKERAAPNSKLCVFQRRSETTDAMIYAAWEQFSYKVH